MAVLDTVRALIQDAGTTSRITNDELVEIMGSAMMELNVWANTAWSVGQLDDVPCLVPLSHQQIFYLIVKILVVDAEIANIDKGLKFVTQDVQLDASSAVTRLNRTKMLLAQELDKKLTYWLGIQAGAAMKHTGESWGGA